jgi:hypothetical protein
MAQRPAGSVREEPPPTSRRERRASRAAPPAPRAGGTPPAGGGRQAARARAEQRRFWYFVMPMIAVLLALTVLVGATIREGDGDDRSDGGDNAGSAARRPTTILLGHRGADGRLDLLVLAGRDRDDASVLLLPTSTQVEVPSLGPLALADLPADQDPDLLATTVENLLGVRVGRTVTIDDAVLTEALDQAAPVPVALNRPAQYADAAGEVVAAGAHRFSAGEAARLLVSDQTGSELDRLVTVQDVLDGWLTRLRQPRVARATLASVDELAALVTVARARRHRTDSLPVESVTTGGGERFEPRPDDVARYVTAAFPRALLGRGVGRPRVEILNGTGAVGLAQRIASLVVPAGGQVTLTGNVQDFGVTETQVVYYRDGDRREAQRLLTALGCGSLKKANRAIGVVDVTIVTGADCFPGTTPGP